MDEIELTKILSSLKQGKLNIKLEQYPTPPEIAAKLLIIASSNGDIKGKIIADLGAGNGILGIGASLLGAKKVFFYDIDEKVLEVCKENLREIGIEGEVINKGIFEINDSFDTVLSNSPFGVQSKFKIDLFLEKVKEISKKFYLILPNNITVNRILEEESLNYLPIDIRIGKLAKFHKKEKYYTKAYIVWN